MSSDVGRGSDVSPGDGVDPSDVDAPADETWDDVAPPAAHRPRHLGSAAQLGRWSVRSQHVSVVALGVVLLVVLVAWWAMRSVPHAQEVSLSSSRGLPGVTVADVVPSVDQPASASGGSSGGTGVGVTAGPSTGQPTRLVVDVAGKVRHPGIVELPTGSRVVDAITAAGGPRPGVSLTSLNLARLLVDGEQIVVGQQVPVLVGAPPGGSASPSATQTVAPVQLNTATADQLETLPGIGPVTAQAILQWRTDNGPFTSVDELLDVSGIGDATLDDIRPYVYV